MQTRKQSIGRKMLRVLEIALFFAISVLGYGLMLKVSSSNAKSKNRDRDSIALRSTAELNGLHRELRVLSGTLLFPRDTATTLPSRDTLSRHAFSTIHPLPTLVRHLLSGNERHSHDLDGDNHLPRPCNLLEQNLVLLN